MYIMSDRNAELSLPHLTPTDNLGLVTLAKIIRARLEHPKYPLFTDPAIYYPGKRFGMFHITYATGLPLEDRQVGFTSRRKDHTVLLTMHSPQSLVDLGGVSRDLSTVAEFIETHDLSPTCVLSTTYEKLGEIAAKRYGFRLTEPQGGLCSLVEKAGVKASYKRGPQKVPMGNLVTVYQPTDEFLQRYGSQQYKKEA